MKCIGILLKLLLCFILALGSNAYGTESITGDWHGTLIVPSTKLRLWLEVSQNEQRDYSATLDSIDQAPGTKIPTSDFKFSKDTLSFFVPKIGAKYHATWNKEAKLWEGKFRQGRALSLNLSRGKPKSHRQYKALVGIWKSDIKGHPLLITVKSSQFGTSASLASPDEGVDYLPIEDIKHESGTVSFHISRAAVKFKGQLADDGQSFSGKWRQQGQPTRNLTFIRRSAPNKTTELKRPQMPQGELPYKVEEVSFSNSQATDVTLAGTLTLPMGKGPFPAAILVSGSGPQDRDESFMGHKPFAVIADHITRQGIAVLRYDDRGVAKSTGAHHEATSLDFASDANAAFELLKSYPQIAPKAIGIIGHSEGGLIAPMAKANNDQIAFIVMLAGPGINTVELMLSQLKAQAKLESMPSDNISQMQAISRELMLTVKNTESFIQAQKAIESILSEQNLATLGVPPTQRDRVMQSYLRPWYRYFIKYDPAHYFKDQSLPILALYGELDTQVTAIENSAGLKALLTQHKDATVMILPNLNHLFQQATSGAISEYKNITQTFSPHALGIISKWISERFIPNQEY